VAGSVRRKEMAGSAPEEVAVVPMAGGWNRPLVWDLAQPPTGVPGGVVRAGRWPL